ncbi:hypothetical protein AAC387_Pa01g1517 [Persea americana]
MLIWVWSAPSICGREQSLVLGTSPWYLHLSISREKSPLLLLFLIVTCTWCGTIVLMSSLKHPLSAGVYPQRSIVLHEVLESHGCCRRARIPITMETPYEECIFGSKVGGSQMDSSDSLTLMVH